MRHASEHYVRALPVSSHSTDSATQNRPGMNYTSLAQMPFSQSPADDGNSSCGDASIQTGRFVLEAPAVGAGKLLSLYVPSDFRSSSYTVSAQHSFLHRVGVFLRVYTGTGDVLRAHFGQQVYTAAVRPGQPSGLDLSWMEFDMDTGSNSIDGADVTHLLPASLPNATKSKLMQDAGSLGSQPGNSDQPLASDSWCGELEVFASVCQVCLQRETVMLHTAASAASSEPAGRMDLYFWRMNTWACQVGVETAPDMPLPSDFHVRSGLTNDIETQRGATSANRQLLQVDEHRRAARRERASVHLHLREEEADGEGAFVFDDANFPSNNAAWLLYAEPTRLLGNYTQGALAGDATDCWSPLEPLEKALVGCMCVLARRDSNATSDSWMSAGDANKDQKARQLCASCVPGLPSTVAMLQV